MAEPQHKLIVRNRKARHLYEIVDTFEAGIELMGTEIKSIRGGNVSIGESHVRIIDHEAFLFGANVAHYEQGTYNNHDPVRSRKLLLHHHEIEKLRIQVEEKGLSIVPLSLYLARGRAKLEIAVVRGKKQVDRRAENRRRDENREAERAAAEARRHR